MAVPMSLQAKHFYAFGPFRLDSEKRVLVRDGRPVPLAPKVAEILLVLVENAGHLVEKDDLMKRVWPDAFVEEANLNKNVFLLRKVLGEWDGGRECIETVPKRGFRFVVPVNEVTHAEVGYRPQTSATAILTGKDVFAVYADVPYAFIECPIVLSRADVEERLKTADVSPEKMQSVIDLLLWFGFLGIVVYPDEERYSYQFQHDLKRMRGGLQEFSYCIQPGFRAALGCRESELRM